MIRFIILLIVFLTQNSVFAQCNGAAASTSSDVNKAIARVSGVGYSVMGALVNNSNQDGRLLFLTSKIPFNGLCPFAINFSTNLYLSDIEFLWNDGTVTSGATVLSVDLHGETALLELDDAPFDTYSLLGVNGGSSPTHCISSDGTNLVRLNIYDKINSAISTHCNVNSVQYHYAASNYPEPATVVRKWASGKTINDYYSLGAPLLSSNIIVGTFITKNNSSDTCYSNDSAYFSKYFQDFNLGFSLANNSIKYTPCIEYEVVNQFISNSGIFEASIRVTGSSVINNVSVIFKAGVEVVLENGFNSGNNFIAEIKPCIAEKEAIYSKTNINNVPLFQEKINLSEKEVLVYPTIKVQDKVTIETKGMNKTSFILVNINGQILNEKEINNSNTFNIDIKNYSKGIYFLKVYSENYSKTFKLLKE